MKIGLNRNAYKAIRPRANVSTGKSIHKYKQQLSFFSSSLFYFFREIARRGGDPPRWGPPGMARQECKFRRMTGKGRD